MKSIHAFSALLPGRAAGVASDPDRGHAVNPVRANANRSFAIADGSVSRNGGKIAAISSLLAVALLQGNSGAGRRRD
jgi:hypothetical protein